MLVLQIGASIGLAYTYEDAEELLGLELGGSRSSAYKSEASNDVTCGQPDLYRLL